MATLGFTKAAIDRKSITGTDLFKWIGERIITLLQHTSLMEKVYCERRELLKLSDEQLADIGISRADVRQECSCRLTDIPHNRKKELVHRVRAIIEVAD